MPVSAAAAATAAATKPLQFRLLRSTFAALTAASELALHGALSAAERRDRCASILRSVGMGDRMHHLPSQLSGGEQ